MNKALPHLQAGKISEPGTLPETVTTNAAGRNGFIGTANRFPSPKVLVSIRMWDRVGIGRQSALPH